MPAERRRPFCVIIPAYNEEPVIAGSLAAIRKVVRPAHIYVVSDGSKDKTAATALRFTKNVLNLKKNRGKAGAIAVLLEKFKLLDRYQYVLFSDADSTLGKGFVDEIVSFAKLDPACIVGKVSSERHGLISAYRTYEYGLTNRVFKQAQSAMRVVTVAPGCASLYKSDVLRQLVFSGRTMTEDFDLTLQIHLKKLGRILYAPRAVVITQDPGSFRDYWLQITRWYTGFWQNLALHKAYIPRRLVFAEIWVLLADSIFWLAALALGIYRPFVFLTLLGLSYLTVFVMAILVLSLEKAWWAFGYIFIFPFFQYLNLSAYVYSLGRAISKRGQEVEWEKLTRYATPTD